MTCSVVMLEQVQFMEPPLIHVDRLVMPNWQRVVKRAFDVSASLFALILLSPVYVWLACAVKMSSKGPVFYRQERVGGLDFRFT